MTAATEAEHVVYPDPSEQPGLDGVSGTTTSGTAGFGAEPLTLVSERRSEFVFGDTNAGFRNDPDACGMRIVKLAVPRTCGEALPGCTGNAPFPEHEASTSASASKRLVILPSYCRPNEMVVTLNVAEIVWPFVSPNVAVQRAGVEDVPAPIALTVKLVAL